MNIKRNEDHKTYQIFENPDKKLFAARSISFNDYIPSIHVYKDYLRFDSYDNYNDIMKRISELKFTRM